MSMPKLRRRLKDIGVLIGLVCLCGSPAWVPALGLVLLMIGGRR